MVSHTLTRHQEILQDLTQVGLPFNLWAFAYAPQRSLSCFIEVDHVRGKHLLKLYNYTFSFSFMIGFLVFVKFHYKWSSFSFENQEHSQKEVYTGWLLLEIASVFCLTWQC
jgi:hypothetical protein